jgi:hypothetical protein
MVRIWVGFAAADRRRSWAAGEVVSISIALLFLIPKRLE